ncbi:thiamine phosphate synthase [Photorhabdus laumondii subsp. laumondii]|uniref:Thiamine-phosphate synthase n=2 Tax=Photorhabdus laumondii subsp. laumondii TaxID=141679 RepID=THIE_PHOLL|nr:MULTISPECIES: thiamine phosphate synthase [Photorhabdus]Q7N964.1 RecName: Full=Thiamine-phosphate synthase; Short=TP synthase; Short=TPS; AltName: Full=Thiamine-phosphate pyrophosphorylase; Short=TMP pyrophosphorylase; Short=TMP-PPase [Photorhabdus laumondii subsp. laumondii TTO1]AWK40449.1 thiamine-phosphate diphosphorylase [Photorhabdus laumondii subsp. laumondii]AXG41257.1 thiamine phosphate synthase [Photorhabdus laumondii subsp. laumondii]AXG45788.1 thiamine phosphate synthase [Photorha
MNNLPNAPFAPTEHRLGLYPVVDSLAWISRLLQTGVTTIQLRIKDLPEDQVEEEIQQAIMLGRQYNARLFINDYWRLAIKHGAYGVHLGQEDLVIADLNAIQKTGLRLGISTHDEQELARAKSLRPSYIALGHIFPTTTKAMPSSPQGVEALKRQVENTPDYSTVAIGGISLERVPDVIATGVGSVALVSAITKAKDWRQATAQLLYLVEGIELKG